MSSLNLKKIYLHSPSERERLILLVPLWSTIRERLIPSTDPDPDQDPRDPRARARERLILLVTRTRKERLNPRERPDQTDPDQDQSPDLVLATKRERLILLSTLRLNFMLRWLILSTMTRERPPPSTQNWM